MTPTYWKRGVTRGLLAVGLGLVAFLIMLTFLQRQAQAQQISGSHSGSTGAVVAGAVQTEEADLSITKTNGLTEVVPGMTVIYTITTRNNSTRTVTNVMMVDFLPIQFEPEFASAFGGNVLAIKFLTFEVGQPVYVSTTLGAGGSLSLVLSGTLNTEATGILTNTAAIQPPGDITDTDPSNNTAIDADPIRVTIPEGELQISKTDDVTQVVSGQAITYTVTVTNPTAFALKDVRITDTLPAGFVFSRTEIFANNGITPDVGSSSGNVITASVSLNPQDVVRLLIYGSIQTASSAWLTNTAVVAAAPKLSRVLGQAATDVDKVADFSPLGQAIYMPLLVRSP